MTGASQCLTEVTAAECVKLNSASFGVEVRDVHVRLMLGENLRTVSQGAGSPIAPFLDQFGSNFVSNPCVVSPKGPKERDFGSGRILGRSGIGRLRHVRSRPGADYFLIEFKF